MNVKSYPHCAKCEIVKHKGGYVLTTNKDLRNVLKSAAQQGWEFECKNNHIKGKHPSGKTTTISRSPSDGRAIKNIMRDLRIA